MSERRLCSLAELPEGALRVFDLGPWSLAACRSGTRVFVLENRCSHDDGALGAGRVVGVVVGGGGGEVECPRHGGRFDVATGRATKMPAVSPIERFDARIAGDAVLVTLPEDDA